jgi:putative Holliday junction resolvase
MLAYPYGTIPAGTTEIAAIVALLADEAPLEVIVGLPRSLSGRDGPAAVKIRSRTEALATALAAAGLPVAVRLLDERLTTVTASRRLTESGKNARQQRSVIDAAAAVTILEHALASERARGQAPGELVSAPEPAARSTPSADGTEPASAQTGERP